VKKTEKGLEGWVEFETEEKMWREGEKVLVKEIDWWPWTILKFV